MGPDCNVETKAPPALQPVRPVTERMEKRGFWNCTEVLKQARISLHNQRYEFLTNGIAKPNAICGCGSKRKFKHCCTSNVIRKAGASWLKPDATADTRRKL